MSFAPASNSISGLILEIAGEDYRELILLAQAWKSVVGKIVARNAGIKSFRHGVIHVGVKNSVWMQEFFFKKHELMNKLHNTTGIEIKDMLFFVRDPASGVLYNG
ncbi:MAG: DUF721 domain-containing protein [Candidatus Cloacimonetes bacterium]|nr:DUF721 domain-containing protein [Candidatus Cloacimonadota bacterium]